MKILNRIYILITYEVYALRKNSSPTAEIFNYWQLTLFIIRIRKCVRSIENNEIVSYCSGGNSFLN